MTPDRPAALDALEAAAHEAGVAETRFRQQFADEILRLETDRRWAYRRFHFLEALVLADAGAADREASRAAQRAAAAEELGWEEIDARRAETMEALEPLADAVHDERLLAAQEAEAGEEAGEGPVEAELMPVSATHSPAAPRAEALLFALAAFEANFEKSRGAPFAELFTRHVQETPLVDF